MVVQSFRRIRRRRLVGLTCALAVVVAGGLSFAALTGVAQAATVGTPTPIVGGQSGRCIDVPNSTTTNGTQMQLWDCSGQANQSWTYTSAKELRVYGNKCLDVTGAATTAGTKVELWDCNGGSNQQWNINSNGTITGVGSGICLDVTSGATANGTKVEIWTCNGGSNQQWARS